MPKLHDKKLEGCLLPNRVTERQNEEKGIYGNSDVWKESRSEIDVTCLELHTVKVIVGKVHKELRVTSKEGLLWKP